MLLLDPGWNALLVKANKSPKKSAKLPRLAVDDSSAERSSFSKSTKLRGSPRVTEARDETQLNAMED